MPGTGETRVLMNADPGKGEDVRPFVEIARHLTKNGFSAPDIFAEDASLGFLLIEDLGDAIFAREIEKDADLEIPLYQAATTVLIDLHKVPPPASLEPYSATLMTDLAALAFEKYQAAVTGILAGEALAQFKQIMPPLLALTETTTPVLIQRDYHSENLLWLPDRPAPGNVGLLDFQDAMLGHPAYDLVSLLQDARRDVSPAVETEMIALFLQKTDYDPETFQRDYAILGVQRSLRILGVFARLCTDYGKPGYFKLIPRVWQQLQQNLEHPALADVAQILNSALPFPTTDALEKLAEQCRP